MASFQAKTGWKRSRKRENKNYCSDPFLTILQQKISKKFKKLKNIIMASFQAKTGLEQLRQKENKNYHSNQFQPDPQKREFQKNSKKIKTN